MRLLALVSLLAWSLALAADQDAKNWLSKMMHAVESLNYEGTFVFMHGEDMEVMHIVHGNDGHGVRERLVSLNGEAREIIREQDVLTCVWPGSHFVVVETSRTRHGLPVKIPADLDKLDDHYQLELSGTDRIAGRDCLYADIKPRDAFRYGYRLCIDEDSGMLLKSVMLTPDGKPIERVMFTSIQLLDSVPVTQFKFHLMDKGFTWHTMDTENAVFQQNPDPSWHITTKPPGFSIYENIIRPIAASSQPVQHIILSDGLASVSVFIAHWDTQKSTHKGAWHKGAMNAYSRVLDDHHITVVGEVPNKTVELIGQSIQRQLGQP